MNYVELMLNIHHIHFICAKLFYYQKFHVTIRIFYYNFQLLYFLHSWYDRKSRFIIEKAYNANKTFI